MIVIGHRGCSDGHAENTLGAIRAALEAGVDWIEIDVRLVDGELAVIHDETVDRTTNGTGSVYDYTIDALRRLDAGHGERIPLLREVIELIDGRAGLNIELKDTFAVSDALREAGRALCRNAAWRHRLMLSSFETDNHEPLTDDLPRGCLFGLLARTVGENLLGYAASLGAYSLNLSRQQLTRDLVAAAHGRRLKVLVYTVNEVQDLQRCLEAGADGIYTDVPSEALAFLAGQQRGEPVGQS